MALNKRDSLELDAALAIEQFIKSEVFLGLITRILLKIDITEKKKVKFGKFLINYLN